MKVLTIVGAVLGIVLSASAVGAVEAAGPVSSSTAIRGESRDLEYLVGPEDVLSIRVYDEEDLTKEAIVTHDGLISYPLLGTVAVSGKSTAELERFMARRLGEKYLVNPQVFVTVKEFNSRRAVVLGMVKEPGPYSLTGRTTVLDLISRAGGLLEESGKNLVLVRGGNRGDVKPGGLQDIAAGGASLASQTKKDEAGRLLSSQEGPDPLLIDAKKLLREGDTSLNHVVGDNDILFVPKTDGVYVYGEVKKPGLVAFRDGLTVLQAVSLAEGLTNHANEGKVQIIRSVHGKERKIKVDLEDITDNEAADVRLQPEDIIVVPESWL